MIEQIHFYSIIFSLKKKSEKHTTDMVVLAAATATTAILSTAAAAAPAVNYHCQLLSASYLATPSTVSHRPPPHPPLPPLPPQ